MNLDTQNSNNLQAYTHTCNDLKMDEARRDTAMATRPYWAYAHQYFCHSEQQ